MLIQEELSIKAMTISQIYSLYCSEKLIVNRKYQRKLCWTIEEKRNFLDTIENGLPVPMFLFAATENGRYEIIDGMQRLDTLCSFISQKYQLKNGFFNLESMPDTIELKRSGKLRQHVPVIDSKVCKDIANYPLPVSVFPAEEDNAIEEVFKRINSTGKHLALQELRQVGVDTQFSNIIRELSSEIRGDVSEDILQLRDMSNISLSNYRLRYAICVDDIFWVKNGIINTAEIRQSRDEEALAYLIANMILPKENQVLLNAQSLNRLYGYSPNPLSREVPLEMTQLNNAIDRIGTDEVKRQFRRVMSCIHEILDISGKTFRQLTNAPKTTSDLIIPFEIVFMAIHNLLITKQSRCVNQALVAKKLDGNCFHILKVAPERKQEAIDTIVGLIQDAFSHRAGEDPAIDSWAQELSNILNKSRTEQVLYDFKIGFVPYGKDSISQEMIEKVLKTLTSINNSGPNKTGYVIVGVADKEEDAIKYQEKYGINYSLINDIPLCGIEHDAIAIGQDIDRYTHSIKESIKKCAGVSEEYKMHILTEMKTALAYNKHTFVFKTCYNKPVTFQDDFYIREFTDVVRLEKDQIANMFSNYYAVKQGS